ncbi:MAG: hypothetical protein M1838_003249 [Thelocarpon superellum]|nr:MAG: hypothetical protein M1838_003249 [Thelocarpon superellum]
MINQRPPSPPLSVSGEPLYPMHPISSSHRHGHSPDEVWCGDAGGGDRGQAQVTPQSSSGPGVGFLDGAGSIPGTDRFRAYPTPSQSVLNARREVNEGVQGVGLGIHFTASPIPLHPQLPSLGHGQTPSAHEPQAYFQPEHHPETPPVSTASDFTSSPDPRRTRGGRGMREVAVADRPMTTSVRKARVAKTPKKKKATARAARRERPKSPELEAPLSVLTAAYTNIQLRDMGTWVHRSAEQRRAEAARKGKVSRPMNCFMLYRSAYTERTKQWCLQNNHQIVSKVSGKSWPKETADIREKYYQYAKIERENHRNAHPGYKFSPSKAPSAAKKRKAQSDESDPSDLEDYDYDWAGGLSPQARHAASGAPTCDTGPATEHFSPPDVPTYWYGAADRHGRALYNANSSGVPSPAMQAWQQAEDTAYRTMDQPGTALALAHVDDARRRVMREQGMISEGDVALTGLPGGAVHDLYHASLEQDASLGLEETMVDPVLLPYGQGVTWGMEGITLGPVDVHQSPLAHPVPMGPLGTLAVPSISSPSLPGLLEGDEQIPFEEWQELAPGWDVSLEVLRSGSAWQTDVDPGSEFDQLYDLRHFERE